MREARRDGTGRGTLRTRRGRQLAAEGRARRRDAIPSDADMCRVLAWCNGRRRIEYRRKRRHGRCDTLRRRLGGRARCGSWCEPAGAAAGGGGGWLWRCGLKGRGRGGRARVRQQPLGGCCGTSGTRITLGYPWQMAVPLSRARVCKQSRPMKSEFYWDKHGRCCNATGRGGLQKYGRRPFRKRHMACILESAYVDRWRSRAISDTVHVAHHASTRPPNHADMQTSPHPHLTPPTTTAHRQRLPTSYAHLRPPHSTPLPKWRTSPAAPPTR